ncbi:anti-sigma factor [Noviherbaspirillum malthae]|uniref:anti-sigma factor n=1 Tax=Noviherbaspirillum malthae TaxID=1260987 RepID=UPI00188F5A89|nr:anti-sigma factor [Noviherbaspirillum malthae]
MNRQCLRDNATLREKLAAEYVLGTLRGGARHRLEEWMSDEPLLRQTAAEWRERLYPLAEFGAAVQPSPQVWDRIEKTLDLRGRRNTPRRMFRHKLIESLHFWRGVGVASTALVGLLAAVLLARQAEPPVPAASHVAVLLDAKNSPALLVSVNTGINTNTDRRLLTVKVLARLGIAADKSLELWAVPQQGAPRSLGLLATDGTITLPLPDDVTPLQAASLAVSLEPKGGSPNRNAPSGPILFKGAWAGT